ncbi:MAG: Vitamin B12 dependent methionine synthase activation subunit [Clostridia bacterium]|nr:Vitamin B12 dependent methionine synthase activation subunit [Clostridia bacterium]
MSIASVKEFAPPAIDRGEILRYMGCKESSAEIEALIDRSLSEAQGVLNYKVAFCELPISADGDLLDLGFTSVRSRDLAKCLQGCGSIVVFAATVGLGLDRLILRYGRISPSVAVCLQAIGAERIEALCNSFCAELVSYGKEPRPRFSPGYGDLPLTLQRDIFRTLECEKRIGLTLNESLLMSPTKSVTAIVGLKS